MRVKAQSLKKEKFHLNTGDIRDFLYGPECIPSLSLTLLINYFKARLSDKEVPLQVHSTQTDHQETRR